MIFLKIRCDFFHGGFLGIFPLQSQTQPTVAENFSIENQNVWRNREKNGIVKPQRNVPEFDIGFNDRKDIQ